MTERKAITLTNQEVQNIVMQLCYFKDEEKFSKCLDILVEQKGEYSHYVAHELVERAKNLQKNGRGKVVETISQAEYTAWKNTVAFTY